MVEKPYYLKNIELYEILNFVSQKYHELSEMRILI